MIKKTMDLEDLIRNQTIYLVEVRIQNGPWLGWAKYDTLDEAEKFVRSAKKTPSKHEETWTDIRIVILESRVVSSGDTK